MKRHALFVGVNNYTDPTIQNLNYPSEDATELASVFRLLLKFDRVEKLINPKHSPEVVDAVKDMTRGLGPGDLFLFFFAGHGFRVKENHVLVCAKDEFADLEDEYAGLPVGQLKKRMRGPWNRMLVLDACQNDIRATRGADTGVTGRDLALIHEAEEPTSDSGCQIVLTACSEGQKALEVSDLGHGLFTSAFLGSITSFADAHHRLDLEALRADLGKRMGGLIAQYRLSGRQEPLFTIPPDASGIVLLDGAVSVAMPSPTLPTATTTPAFVVCPVCGKHNRIEETFKCKVCDKDHICLEHFLKEHNCCTECKDAVLVKQQEKVQEIFEKGENYYHGRNGFQKDLIKAFELYKKAADDGHSGAQLQVARMYRTGEGVAKDELQALLWFMKASASGSANAMKEALQADGERVDVKVPDGETVQLHEGVSGDAYVGKNARLVCKDSCRGNVEIQEYGRANFRSVSGDARLGPHAMLDCSSSCYGGVEMGECAELRCSSVSGDICVGRNARGICKGTCYGDANVGEGGNLRCTSLSGNANVGKHAELVCQGTCYGNAEIGVGGAMSCKGLSGNARIGDNAALTCNGSCYGNVVIGVGGSFICEKSMSGDIINRGGTYEIHGHFSGKLKNEGVKRGGEKLPENDSRNASVGFATVVCPDCGTYNEITNTFKCKVCGRDHLCKDHFSKEEKCCTDCAAKVHARRAAEEKARLVALPKTGDVKTLVLPCGAEMEMIYCAPGEFMMGSPESEEGRYDNEVLHRVKLTKGFWLGKYPVTQGQWQSVMGNNPAEFKGDARLPVETVSWDDCEEFIEKVKSSVKQQLGGEARFPTEAEWEYACRAGTTTAYYWGNALNGDRANCDGNHPCGTKNKGPYLKKTTPVGRYGANAWGFCDMHGNVWEWCADWYGDHSGDVVDPTGPASGPGRMIRGGNWDEKAFYCRSAHRYNYCRPGYRSNHFGFRLCCSAGPRG